MRVRQLQLSDFRSYAHAQVLFDEGPSILVGPNGHGKTNLVEALVYLANLRSHRVACDAPLVRQGCEQAVIRAEILHESRRAPRRAGDRPRQVEQGAAEQDRARPPPRDHRRAQGHRLRPRRPRAGPRRTSARRRYLDELLCSRLPRYAGVRADYERVLKQRNTLLRTAYLAKKTGGRGPGGAEMATLDAWDAHLARHGAELLAGRLALLEDLTEPVAKAHSRIADGRSEVHLTYESELGADLTADQDVLTARLAPRSPRPARRRSSAGPPSSAPTATTSTSRSARSRCAATPPTARPGRWPWHCAWAPSNSCDPTAPRRSSSSTTCSPNSTPRGASASPNTPSPPRRRSSPAPSPGTSPSGSPAPATTCGKAEIKRVL